MNILSFDVLSYLNVSFKQICSRQDSREEAERDCVGAPVSQKVERYHPRHLEPLQMCFLKNSRKRSYPGRKRGVQAPDPHPQGRGWKMQLWVGIWCDRELKFVGNQGKISLSKTLIIHNSSPLLSTYFVPSRLMLSLLFNIWKNWDLEKRNDLPKIKQLVSRRNTVQTQACLTQS